ncbi:hypothetical protein DY000_02002927 [Brassica cretica]|uniref:Uncharacterized protein n=1 Tax=Brassica cretica TaxID=69181 RepID=A0ABQ7C775_BRACR|nr:hypothetical protein DY000_02002927 [Brassica cretica]
MALGEHSNLNGVVGTFAFVVWLSMKGLVVWAQHIQLLGASPTFVLPFAVVGLVSNEIVSFVPIGPCDHSSHALLPKSGSVQLVESGHLLALPFLS